MRSKAWLFAVLLAGCAAASPDPLPTACAVPAGFESATADVTRLANAFRAESDLPALGAAPALTQAAQDHACFLARTGTLSHTGQGGSEVSDRMEAAGYLWRFAAENVAFGQPFASSVVGSWKGSTGHRKNMLSEDATEIGVGLAASPDGVLYWVMVLGAPR